MKYIFHPLPHSTSTLLRFVFICLFATAVIAHSQQCLAERSWENYPKREAPNNGKIQYASKISELNNVIKQIENKSLVIQAKLITLSVLISDNHDEFTFYSGQLKRICTSITNDSHENFSLIDSWIFDWGKYTNLSFWIIVTVLPATTLLCALISWRIKAQIKTKENTIKQLTSSINMKNKSLRTIYAEMKNSKNRLFKQ